MPAQNLILVMLIGVVFGVIAAVIQRGRGSLFIVNMLLGVIGASLGALLPVLLDPSAKIDAQSLAYLLRALGGSFLLVLLAGLFRSSKPRTLD